MTQAKFQEYYTEYLNHFQNQGINAFNLDVKALSTWVSEVLNTSSCQWETLREKLPDIYGNPLQVRILDGVKFVCFTFKETQIYNKIGCRVYACNMGQYGKNNPIKFENDSFYNNDGELIYYHDEQQKERLLRDYKYNKAESIAWVEWYKVKDQVNNKTFTPMPGIVADHMLNCVPPVRLTPHRFLTGEAYSHNENGEAIYLECRQIKGEKWEAKYTTVKEFDK